MRTVAKTSIAILLAALVLGVASPIILVAALVWGVTWLTGTMAKALEPRTLDWRALVAFDPVLGWRPIPGLDTYHVSTRDPEVFHLVTDAEGWIGPAPIEMSDVIVLGDSFAWGYAVDYEHSYVAVRPNPVIKGVGAPGYNMVQELLLLRQLAPRLSGKLVVWLLYYGNDLYDNLSPEMAAYPVPFVVMRDGAWRIENSHVSPERWRASKGRHGNGTHSTLMDAIHSPSWLSERAFSACRYLLSEGKRICDDAGAVLVLFTIPSPTRLGTLASLFPPGSGPASTNSGYADECVAKMCLELGITCVHGSEIFLRKHFRPKDDHWTRSGHLVFNEAIRKIRDHPSVRARLRAPARPAELVETEAALSRPASA